MPDLFRNHIVGFPTRWLKSFLHQTFFVLSFVGALGKDCGCALWFWHVLDFSFLLDDKRFDFVSVWQTNNIMITPPNKTDNDMILLRIKSLIRVGSFWLRPQFSTYLGNEKKKSCLIPLLNYGIYGIVHISTVIFFLNFLLFFSDFSVGLFTRGYNDKLSIQMKQYNMA